MISWTAILYGAALSALFGGLLVAAADRGARLPAGAGAAVGAFAGPIAWNAILRATHAATFFTDAPIAVMPASWQDTGSGVFTIAVTAIVLGFGAHATAPARRVVALSMLAGLAAFLVDVYLY
ncbi:hypothetical protein ACPPVO_26105 [Dactylosporangium sp. McL0621]|uniref:hypothetical protein n=1 Tax=Dactylosporangium sp. McL0621 TaxID=3415678 RepID=UPI003CFB2778